MEKKPNFKQEFRFHGFESVTKKVAKHGGGVGRLYVPKSWVGKYARIVRMEE